MNKLQQIRKQRGLSQSQLSEKSHVKLINIQMYETNKRNINTAQVNNVYKLAKAIDVTIEELLDLEKIEKEVN